MSKVSMTRAQFIQARVDEANIPGAFICPEVNVTQNFSGGKLTVDQAADSVLDKAGIKSYDKAALARNKLPGNATKPQRTRKGHNGTDKEQTGGPGSVTKTTPSQTDPVPKAAAWSGKLPSPWSAEQSSWARAIGEACMDQGLTFMAACGLIGNAMQESFGAEGAMTNNPGCTGLWCWSAEDGNARATLIAEQYLGDIAGQTKDALAHGGDYPKSQMITKLNACQTASAAAAFWGAHWEHFGIAGSRTTYAELAFKSFKATGGRPGSPSDDPTGGASQSTETTTLYSISGGDTYWAGCLSLASDVGWVFAEQGNDLMYVNAVELILAQPVATIDMTSGVVSTHMKIQDDGTRGSTKAAKHINSNMANLQITAPSNYATQIMMDLALPYGLINAGDCIVITDSNGNTGPWLVPQWTDPQGQGCRWVCTNVTGSLVSTDPNTYTFELPGGADIPWPLNEPSYNTAGGTGPSIGAATVTGNKLVNRIIAAAKAYPRSPYSQSPGTSPDGKTRNDCSGSVSDVLTTAGVNLSAVGGITAVSTSYMNAFSAGKGNLMTIWASNIHVFLEFHVSGKWYQFNTSSGEGRAGGDFGPHYGEAPGPANSSSGSGGLVPRHIQGT